VNDAARMESVAALRTHIAQRLRARIYQGAKEFAIS
jgi:hypothetical protein